MRPPAGNSAKLSLTRKTRKFKYWDGRRGSGTNEELGTPKLAKPPLLNIVRTLEDFRLGSALMFESAELCNSCGLTLNHLALYALVGNGVRRWYPAQTARLDRAHY
ncbi:hypothetical protein CSIM01_12214 [Colletotrichum simmondsii]|uniref:Uncharacterized protein n=1 Tax=Colletotrichum simmondsii TaxID=703756 RepID=A0A135RXL0_9PEZI|nr:hypothetical protein CSIM01_12214 [Colletotrichum simmondsii]